MYMDYIIHKEPAKRPFVGGTYNGHPVAVAAAIRTIEYLLANRGEVYGTSRSWGGRWKRACETYSRRIASPLR